MRRAAALGFALIFTACASSQKPPEEPSTVPPPQPVAEASPAVEARLNELQTSMTELLDRLDVLNARIARLETAGASPAAQSAPRPVPLPATVPAASQKQTPVQVADIAESYRQAIILFGQGKNAEARAVFQQVFDADPGGSLADNALFWIGETYYATGDFTTAMRYYERVIREYAEQNKAPDAMLKLGMAYVKTGDLAMAQRTFEECVQKYPYSSAASSAKQELKRIKY